MFLRLEGPLNQEQQLSNPSLSSHFKHLFPLSINSKREKISFIFCQSWFKKGRRLLEDDIWTDPNTAPGILFLLAEN